MERKRWLVVVALIALIVMVVLLRRREAPVTETATSASAPPIAPSPPHSALPIAPTANGSTEPASTRSLVRTLAWGSGPTQIGLPPEDEAEGETPLRLATDGNGLLLLDNTNGRVLQMRTDGGVGIALRPPIKNPRDIAVAKDGSLAYLDAEHVTLTGADGRPRGKFAVPPGTSARSVVVSGNDVYVESNRGTFTRVGDIQGGVDPNPKPIPGQPTRDGRGYLKAVIANSETGSVHVFVIERETLKQRFSRELVLPIRVEGIFLVDTDRAGTIYLGLTGTVAQGADVVARLVCLEAEHGEAIGAADLPLQVGPEAVLDGKALDEGGIVYSIFSKGGVRVERQNCNSP